MGNLIFPFSNMPVSASTFLEEDVNISMPDENFDSINVNMQNAQNVNDNVNSLNCNNATNNLITVSDNNALVLSVSDVQGISGLSQHVTQSVSHQSRALISKKVSVKKAITCSKKSVISAPKTDVEAIPSTSSHRYNLRSRQTRNYADSKYSDSD